MFHYNPPPGFATQCHPPGNKTFLGQRGGIGWVTLDSHNLCCLQWPFSFFSAPLRTVSVREASRNATGVAEVVGQHIVNQLATRQALARKVGGRQLKGKPMYLCIFPEIRTDSYKKENITGVIWPWSFNFPRFSLIQEVRKAIGHLKLGMDPEAFDLLGQLICLRSIFKDG